MPSFSSFVAPFLLSVAGTALATSCIAFDSSWNLLALGFEKDYNAGTKESWSSGSPKDITTTGRPPFDGAHTTCYLSQYSNTIYVLAADASKPSTIYIYDAGKQSWTSRTPGTAGFDPTSYVANLDHDTDVFYAMSKGEMYSLNMTAVTAGEDIAWNDVGAPTFTTTGYEPVMGLASNHIHFIGVPGTAAGSANIYVIHFSYFQPEIQPYGNFPASHGQTASVFLQEATQKEFIYVPDDGSATYVVDVVANTTQALPGPPVKDSSASYFASPDNLVQLSWKGISYMPYSPGSASANKAASWTSIANLASVLTTATASPTATNTAAGAAGTTKQNGGNSNSTTTNNNGAMQITAAAGALTVMMISSMVTLLG